jgi:hypothetical protein
MFRNILKFLLRISCCTFTFHVKGDKIQSNKAYYVYSCSRCGTMFAVKKDKYKGDTLK